MVLNFVVALVLVITKRGTRHFIFSGTLILVTIPFWNRTFQYSQADTFFEESISLLSYNAKLFRQSGVYDRFSMEMIEWVVRDGSDIKCIQEFSTNSRWPSLDIRGQIEAKGYHSYEYKASREEFGDHNPGMAIFSKHPMIGHGVLPQHKDGINAIIYADLLIGEDTLRIYNIHLLSYHLNFNDGSATSFQKVLNIIRQVKNVVIDHTHELNQLVAHVEKCEIPYILTGDFNESPFSYNYQMLNHLQNAFEEKGKGFGFTMIKPPLFLRLDNMYYGDAIELHSFEVDYEMDISDHYPLKSSFRIKNK